jgi:hypothetical protein
MENAWFLDCDGKPLDLNNNDYYSKFVRTDCILCVNPAIGYALEKIEPGISNDSNKFFAAYIAACRPDDLPIELSENGDTVATDYTNTFINTEHGVYNYSDYFNFVRENLKNYGDTVVINGYEYFFEYDWDKIHAIPDDDNVVFADVLTYTPDEFINLIFELIGRVK